MEIHFSPQNQTKILDYFDRMCNISNTDNSASSCFTFIATHKKYVQVVPGRAGGGSFRRKKTYIAKKEFAYRMCARRPTSAMPKPFLCCEPAFCCSMVVM